MLKRFFCLSILLASIHPLDAMTVRREEVYYDDEDGNYVEEDVWFGPGFYYGIWFDNEDNYWAWRHNHRGYPPNHGYYHHDHPVHYHGGKHRDHGGDGHHGGHHK